MTLAEFLLARLDEAQVAATLREWHQRDCNTIPAPGSEYSYPCDCGVPEWMGRDVAAKRRIVEEHGANQHRVDPCDAQDPSGRTIPCDTLRFLALPYADHPDYREEWKP